MEKIDERLVGLRKFVQQAMEFCEESKVVYMKQERNDDNKSVSCLLLVHEMAQLFILAQGEFFNGRESVNQIRITLDELKKMNVVAQEIWRDFDQKW